ncbi:hypothetical protein [Acinetobacter oleivorans]|uniref:hypothetical protein n=1 Tax=Acinetobacter oleivorans TaxID=1148157 RepID=UPI001250A32F|nr:hypothetical protein [Acinetobacter oleivorans]
MDKCREEFERSKTFKYFYSTLMHFDEELNCYSSNNSLRVRDAELLTAAWWSFQEQQAKVEELQKRVGAAIEAINEHYDSDGTSGLYFMDLKEILEGEQALKGEG